MTTYALDGMSPSFTPGEFWIAPDAAVIGRVLLHRNASVWFGAVLRGDGEPIIIGEDSNVQDGCVFHTDQGYPLTVGKGCTIGHKVILHGCTIGDNSLIGMGATILNGAKVGRNCLIGANALITEGKEIPDGSMVLGAPGRVVRVLTDAEIHRNGEAARHYVANWKRFTRGLKALP